MRNPFLRTAMIATIAYFVVGRVPILHGVLGWIVLIGAPFLLIRNNPALDTMSSPLGYVVGMGALVGAIANEVGTVLGIFFNLVVASIGAASSTVAGGVTALGAGVGITFQLVHLLYGPFVGAVLGLIGGLIAGSMRPKSPSNGVSL